MIAARTCAVILVVGLCGCFPHVAATEFTPASSSDRVAAANVRIFTVGQNSPTVLRAIGSLTAFSCKYLAWDRPASRGDALEQLQLRAAAVGANAVINVTFDTRAGELGVNCWETVQASGTAVQIADER